MATPAEQRRKNRKRWMAVGVCLLLIIWWAIENFAFHISETVITDEKIRNEVTVALISDLHGMSYGPDNCLLMEAVRSKRPDLVLALGDLYSSDAPSGRKTALRLMEQLAAEYPVYFAPGEHDRDERFYDELDAVGVHVLDYTYAPVTVGATRLTLYGITNAYFSDTFDLANEFDSPGTETYNILMAHIPYAQAYRDWGPDLAVCGDTHGGIVQLPLWGPLYYQGSWIPKAEGRTDVYDKGLFDLGDTQLYVTAGLGNHPAPLRLFNQPELTILHLQPEG